MAKEETMDEYDEALQEVEKEDQTTGVTIPRSTGVTGPPAYYPEQTRPRIQDVVDRLHSEITELEGKVVELTNLLHPVLLPSEESRDVDPLDPGFSLRAQPPGRSDLAGLLGSAGDRLASLRIRMQELKERVEL
jgi:hypothetical protein